MSRISTSKYTIENFMLKNIFHYMFRLDNTVTLGGYRRTLFLNLGPVKVLLF